MRIVPRQDLERANARFVTVETMTLDLAGPLLAGVLFVLAPWAPFAASAACFLGAAAVVVTIPTPAPTPASRSTTLLMRPARRPAHRSQIRAGLQRLFADPVLRVLVGTVAVMATANAATDAMLVIYGTQTLGMSDGFYPTLLVAYSVGTLLAAALVGRANSRLRGGPMMMVALFGISATMLVLGLVPTVGVALAAYRRDGPGRRDLECAVRNPPPAEHPARHDRPGVQRIPGGRLGRGPDRRRARRRGRPALGGHVGVPAGGRDDRGAGRRRRRSFLAEEPAPRPDGSPDADLSIRRCRIERVTAARPGCPGPAGTGPLP